MQSSATVLQSANEILLNNTVETNAEIKAADVIPEGYLLYSPDAKYVLKIDSGSTPSEASIYDSKNVAGSNTVSTFYYDAGVTYNKTGDIPNVVDYGNTHVAFAVLLVPSIIPDAVVIDYGLPVKISALANDLSIPAGTGDSFRVDSTNGLFTFTNSSELSFAYNGVVVGSDYGSASFFIYKAGEDDTYTRVNSTDELEDGGKYLVVYDGTTDMIVCPVSASADSSTSTYRTL